MLRNKIKLYCEAIKSLDQEALHTGHARLVKKSDSVLDLDCENTRLTAILPY